MPVVYRVKKVYVCRLTTKECSQEGKPNCKVGCALYKEWDKSGIRAKDYACQTSVEDFSEGKD